MQIDELRGELTTLADEIDPFAGDVRALHRRERHRRIAVSSLVLAVAVALIAVSTATIVHRGADGKVQISGAGSKQVSLPALNRIGAIVVPASPTVQRVLDTSAAVSQYALMPRAAGSEPNPSGPRAAACALRDSSGFAVEATNLNSGLATELETALAGRAQVFDVSEYFGSDIEVFMKVDATATQIDAARVRIETDPNVSSFSFVTQADAYDIFKRDFADQPALVESTKPTDLPASFRIDVKPGVSANAEAEKFQGGAYDSVVTLSGIKVFSPVSLPSGSARTERPCGKP